MIRRQVNQLTSNTSSKGSSPILNSGAMLSNNNNATTQQQPIYVRTIRTTSPSTGVVSVNSTAITPAVLPPQLKLGDSSAINDLGSKTLDAVSKDIGTGGGALSKNDVSDVVTKFVKLAGVEPEEVVNAASNLISAIGTTFTSVKDVVTRLKSAVQVDDVADIYDQSDATAEGVNDQDSMNQQQQEVELPMASVPPDAPNTLTRDWSIDFTHNKGGSMEYRTVPHDEIVSKLVKGPPLSEGRRVDSYNFDPVNGTLNLKTTDTVGLLGGMQGYNKREEVIRKLKELGIDPTEEEIQLAVDDSEESLSPAQELFLDDLDVSAFEFDYLTDSIIRQDSLENKCAFKTVIMEEKESLRTEGCKWNLDMVFEFRLPLSSKYVIEMFSNCYCRFGNITNERMPGLNNIILTTLMSPANMEYWQMYSDIIIVGKQLYSRILIFDKNGYLNDLKKGVISIKSPLVNKDTWVKRTLFHTKWAVPSFLFASKFLHWLNNLSDKMWDSTACNYPLRVFKRITLDDSITTVSFNLIKSKIGIDHLPTYYNSEKRYSLSVDAKILGGMLAGGKTETIAESLVNNVKAPVLSLVSSRDWNRVVPETEFVLASENYGSAEIQDLYQQNKTYTNPALNNIPSQTVGMVNIREIYNINDNFTRTWWQPNFVKKNYSSVLKPTSGNTEGKTNINATVELSHNIAPMTSNNLASFNVSRAAAPSINKAVQGPFVHFMGTEEPSNNNDALVTTLPDFYWVKAIYHALYESLADNNNNQMINTGNAAVLNAQHYDLTVEAAARDGQQGPREIWWTTATEFFDNRSIYYNEQMNMLNNNCVVFLDAAEVIFSQQANVPIQIPANNGGMLSPQTFAKLVLQCPYYLATRSLSAAGPLFADINSPKATPIPTSILIVIWNKPAPVAAEYNPLYIQIDETDAVAFPAIAFRWKGDPAILPANPTGALDRRDPAYYLKLANMLDWCHKLCPDSQARERAFRQLTLHALSYSQIGANTLFSGQNKNYSVLNLMNTVERQNVNITDGFFIPGNLTRNVEIPGPSSVWMAASTAGYLVFKPLKTALTNTSVWFNMCRTWSDNFKEVYKYVAHIGQSLYLTISVDPEHAVPRGLINGILDKISYEFGGYPTTIGPRNGNLPYNGGQLAGLNFRRRLAGPTHWLGSDKAWNVILKKFQDTLISPCDTTQYYVNGLSAPSSVRAIANNVVNLYFDESTIPLKYDNSVHFSGTTYGIAAAALVEVQQCTSSVEVLENNYGYVTNHPQSARAQSLLNNYLDVILPSMGYVAADGYARLATAPMIIQANYPCLDMDMSGFNNGIDWSKLIVWVKSTTNTLIGPNNFPMPIVSQSSYTLVLGGQINNTANSAYSLLKSSFAMFDIAADSKN